MDVMAELAKKTHIPLTTGERIFTKWGFRESLEKRAATILAAGSLLRGLHYRTAHHCRHGQSALFAAGSAQSAVAVLGVE